MACGIGFLFPVSPGTYSSARARASERTGLSSAVPLERDWIIVVLALFVVTMHVLRHALIMRNRIVFAVDVGAGALYPSQVF